MEKQLTSEIKNILVGRTVTDQDGWCVAAEGHSCVTFYGILSEGTTFGITEISKKLQVANDSKIALQKLVHLFQDFGKLTILKSDAETLACVRRNCFCKTVLLTAKNIDEGKVLLTAYTARGLLSRLICKNLLKSIEKKLHH